MTAPPAPIVPQAPVTILDVFIKQIELAGEVKLIRQELEPVKEHERRLRELETFRAEQAGASVSKGKLFAAAVGASAIVSAVATWVGLILTHR